MEQKIKVDKVEIDGSIYVRQDLINQESEKLDGMDYVVIRAKYAGVFIGYLKSKEDTLSGRAVILVNSRNIFYWNGASGISQIAEEGIADPITSKLTMPVKLREISEVIEILNVTQRAKENLDKITSWKK